MEKCRVEWKLIVTVCTRCGPQFKSINKVTDILMNYTDVGLYTRTKMS